MGDETIPNTEEANGADKEHEGAPLPPVSSKTESNKQHDSHRDTNAAWNRFKYGSWATIKWLRGAVGWCFVGRTVFWTTPPLS